MSENSIAWEKVFDRLHLQPALDAHGFCYVTADEIKEHGVREPRLMAKMDTLRDRPTIFVENQVNIFPVRNGKYVIFKDPENKTYFKFRQTIDQTQIRKYTSSTPLSSFDTFPH